MEKRSPTAVFCLRRVVHNLVRVTERADTEQIHELVRYPVFRDRGGRADRGALPGGTPAECGGGIDLRRGKIRDVDYHFREEQTEIYQHRNDEHARNHFLLPEFFEAENYGDGNESEDADDEDICDIAEGRPRGLHRRFDGRIERPELNDGIVHEPIEKRCRRREYPGTYIDEGARQERDNHFPQSSGEPHEAAHDAGTDCRRARIHRLSCVGVYDLAIPI